MQREALILDHSDHAATAHPAPMNVHAARIGAFVLFAALVVGLVILYRRLVDRARAEEASQALEREFEALEREPLPKE